MSDRTTLNITQESHSKAAPVKDEYDETWTEVVEFYAEHRPSLSIGDSGANEKPIKDVDALANQISDQVGEHIQGMDMNVTVESEDLSNSGLDENGIAKRLKKELSSLSVGLDASEREMLATEIAEKLR